MAGSSAGSIFVDLLLRDAQYRQGLNNSRSVTRSWSNQTQNDVNGTTKAFQGVLNPISNIGNAVVRLSGVFASAFSVQQIVQYSDAWRQLEGRLNLVTSSGLELANVQERLFGIAQETRSDLSATVTLYQRLTSATQGLGVSQEEIFKFTEQLNKQLITAGLSSNEAAASIYQLTQAFNKGKLDGDEFRTLLESAPPILEALQKSLNVTRGEILQMSKDGKLAPRVLIDAVNSMAEVTDKRFSDFNLTVGQAFTQLNNSMLKFVGTSEQATYATSVLAKGLQVIAGNLDVIANAALVVSGIFVSRLGAALGLSLLGWINNTKEAIRYAATLQAMSIFSARAATGIFGMVTATTILSRSMAFLGGPIGAAIFALGAAFTVLSLRVDETGKATDESNAAFQKMQELNNQLIVSTGANTAEIKKQRDALLKDTEAQLDNAKAKLENLKNTYELTVANARLANFGLKPSEVNQEAVRQTDANIKELENRLAALKTESSKGDAILGASGGSSGPSKELQRNLEKYQYLIKGVTKENFAYAESEKQLNELYKARLITSNELFVALEGLDQEYDKNRQTVTLWGLDISEVSKNAANRIQETFADFLFDPFQDGVKGMAKGFVDSVRRMIAEAQAAQLVKALFGDKDDSSSGKGGSGLLGGVLKSVSSSIGNFFGGFFADGGFLGPGQWGVAGEQGPELIYGGQTGKTVIPNGGQQGGNVYNIDARGADQGAVLRLERALMLLAGPGQVEQRIGEAQVRGEL